MIHQFAPELRRTRPLLLLLLAFVPSRVAATESVSVQARCEAGGYVDSANSCEQLAAQTSDAAVAKQYRLRAARHHLWECRAPRNGNCQKALQILWSHSDDPAEVTMAAGLFQKVCAEEKTYAACQNAGYASWYGRGVPVDATASFRWGLSCKDCKGFSPDYMPTGYDGPWTNVESSVRATRIRALVAAGFHAEAIQIFRHERAQGAIPADLADQLGDELAAARWRAEVEPLLAKPDVMAALAVADNLVTLIPTPSVAARRDRLRAELQGHHLETMKRAKAAHLPMTEWVHALIAKNLGATVDVPPDATPSWNEIPIHPKVTGLTESCAWLAPTLNERYAPAKANVEVHAPLTCSHWTEKRTFQGAPKTTYETTTVERRKTVKGECRTRSVMSVSGYKAPGEGDMYLQRECDADTVETSTENRTTPVTRTTTEVREVNVVAVKGALDGPLGSATFTETKDGFSSPEYLAAQLIAGQIEPMLDRVKREQIAKEEAKAKGAPPLVVEEHDLRILTLGGYPKVEGATGFSRYDIGVLLAKGTLSPSYAREIEPAKAGTTVPAPIETSYEASRYPEPKLGALAAPNADVPTVTRTSSDGDHESWLQLPRATLLGVAARLRSGGAEDSRGVGVRAEAGFSIDDGFDLGYGVMLGAGYDTKLGASFDGQLAVGPGYKSELVQALWIGGFGYGALGARDARGGTRTDTGFDVFHGPDLTIGAQREGLAVHGRFLWVYGGAITAGTRITGELVYRGVAGNELGIAVTRDHLSSDENVLALGLVYRTDRWR